MPKRYANSRAWPWISPEQGLGRLDIQLSYDLLDQGEHLLFLFAAPSLGLPRLFLDASAFLPFSFLSSALFPHPRRDLVQIGC